jgi:hypothetical protein
MPITRKQFVLGIDNATKEWMKRLHSSLTEHKAEAFSAQELAEREGVQWDTFNGELFGDARFVQYALDKLAEVGWLEKRYVRDDWYYAYSGEWNEEEIV